MIAYALGDDILAMNPDGSGMQVLTPPSSGQNFGPSWSPDGQKIVFARVNPFPNNADIRVMNADGSGDVGLTPNNPSADLYPAWSPDGQKIAFTRDNTVAVMNADGTGQTELAAGQLPAWSPDSRKISFQRYWVTPDSMSQSDIFVMNSDGSGVTNLTNDTALESMSSWSQDRRRRARICVWLVLRGVLDNCDSLCRDRDDALPAKGHVEFHGDLAQDRVEREDRARHEHETSHLDPWSLGAPDIDLDPVAGLCIRHGHHSLLLTVCSRDAAS